MSKPARPEYDAILAQQILLQQITGGDDWHTSIGATVYATVRPMVDQAGYISCTNVDVEPRGKPYNDALITLTWTAVLDMPDDDSLDPALVLADMRHALLCGDRRLSIVAASITQPEAGSDYAAVTLTTSLHTP